MPVKVQIRLDAQIMADFMVYHIFSGAMGMVAVILAALNAGLAIVFVVKKSYLFALAFIAFVFVIAVVFPRIIRRRTVKQMERYCHLSDPVTYEFEDTGITTTTWDDSGKASWGKFKRAVRHRNLLLLYDERKQAIILPVDQIGEDYGAVVDMITGHMPASAVKIGGKQR